jgi:peptidoglycan/LPS O-acetylase OafA/YrhL
MPEPIEGSKSYIPALDGIRALAVLAVIFYHLGYGWAQGGLLGVNVFFVLSGYLITDLLLGEYKKNGFVKLKMFWLRRARRLLPALFTMLFIVLGWCALFNTTQLPQVKSDMLPAMFYYSNWWFIFEHVSYFAQFGPPTPLGHLWSLAIEEQFYLIWPLLIIAIMKISGSKKVLGMITTFGIAASVSEMAILYQPYADPTRLYDGTDTRAFALLIGALLAIYRPRDKKVIVSQKVNRLANILGGLSFLGLLLMFWQTNEYSRFLYQGGMLVSSLLTVALITIAILPTTAIAKLLSTPLLKWIGERSYGVYIWHYPIIILTTPYNAPPNLVRSVLQIAASFAFATLSWKYLEQPIRHGAIGTHWNRYKKWRLQPTVDPRTAKLTSSKLSIEKKGNLTGSNKTKTKSVKPSKIYRLSAYQQIIHVYKSKPPRKRLTTSLVSLLLTTNTIVCLLAVAGVIQGSKTDYSGESDNPTSIVPKNKTSKGHLPQPATTVTVTYPTTTDAIFDNLVRPVKAIESIPFMNTVAEVYDIDNIEKNFFYDSYPFAIPRLAPVPISTFNLPPLNINGLELHGTRTRVPISGVGVTAIGDSIMIDAAPYLKQMLPDITIDAIVGQQIWQVQADVPKLKREGAIGNYLIIELGTNGGYTAQELLHLIASLGPMKKIVLVNALVPDPWGSEVNSSIATVATTLHNVSVVNWYQIGQKHPNYFYPDHIHLNPVGAKFYAKLIVRALESGNR